MKSLGRVVYDRPFFHAKSCIMPLGYVAERMFWSDHEAGARIMYRLEVVLWVLECQGNTAQTTDGGDAPLFCITSPDARQEYSGFSLEGDRPLEGQSG